MQSFLSLAVPDVPDSVESSRASGQATLLEDRRKLGPVLVVGAIVSVAVVCAVYLTRRDHSRPLPPPYARQSYLTATLRAVVVSVARVALLRVAERLTMRVAQ